MAERPVARRRKYGYGYYGYYGYGPGVNTYGRVPASLAG